MLVLLNCNVWTKYLSQLQPRLCVISTLNRLIGKEDVLVNCCCPGWVRTDMAGPNAALSPDEGAQTPVHLALLPTGSPNGEFWKNKAVVQW